MPDHTYSLSEAYEHCRSIATQHYENFPVGSILIPKKNRPYFFALYAFMRTADDFADLPHRSKEERLALLADWRRQLEESLSGEQPMHPIFIALQNTVTECSLSSAPLYRLLEAFEFDAKGEVRFETFDDLRWYTSRSADPVGELVLALFGYNDPRRIRLSNEICSGLQLLNFIQDIKEDLANDRQYFPREDWSIFGIDLDSGSTDSDRLSLLSLFELERVETLLDRGTPLAESVSGRLRYELRAVIRAARKMIAKIRRLDGNTFDRRPKLSKWESFLILMQSVFIRTGNG